MESDDYAGGAQSKVTGWSLSKLRPIRAGAWRSVYESTPLVREPRLD